MLPYPKLHLQNLKERIRQKASQKQCHLTDGYKTPEELGNLLLADMKEAIKRDFPHSEAYLLIILALRLFNLILFDFVCRQTPMAKHLAEHQNYAHQLCAAYIPRTSYSDDLDYALVDEMKDTEKSYMAESSSGSYLLITGESGGGKSSLIAKWWRTKSSNTIQELQGQQVDNPTIKPIFLHFVGASGLASNFSGMLKRLFEEVNSKLPKELRVSVLGERYASALPALFESASLNVYIYPFFPYGFIF